MFLTTSNTYTKNVNSYKFVTKIFTLIRQMPKNVYANHEMKISSNLWHDKLSLVEGVILYNIATCEKT